MRIILRLVSLASVAAWGLALPRPAVAQSSSGAAVVAPLVRVVQCASLDAERVRRLLQVELAVGDSLPAEAQRYQLEVSCDADEVELSVLDRNGRERLRRSIHLPSGDPDPERAVALAAAELLFALSWVPPAQQAAPVQTPVGTGRSAVSVTPKAAETPPAPWLSVGVVTSSQVRSFATQPLGQVSAGLQGTWEAKSWVLGVAGGWAGAWQQRSLGRVDGQAGWVELSFGYSHAVDESWAVMVIGALGGHFVRLRGDPNTSDVRGGDLTGWATDVSASVGPRWRIGAVRLSLLGRLGVTPGEFEGRVQGEPDVLWGGGWVGAGLGVAYTWRHN